MPISLILAARAPLVAQPTQLELFRSGEGGYRTYRIPALITTRKGTRLASCEGRKNGGGDAGDIDILLRRSFDNGRTWAAVQKLADFGADTVGNPAPVIERKSGVIILLLSRNPGSTPEKKIPAGLAHVSRTVWITRSKDGPDWTWYATGPGNGIQLKSGRLIILCDHNQRGTDKLAMPTSFIAMTAAN